MNKLVTIKTFTYPHELAIIRSKLESEGIYCFAQDELTAQVHPFYSNAIGGIKLQVREEDIEKAITILKENGDIKDQDLYPSGLQIKLYRLLSRLPFFRKIYK
ncbi:MAG: DUF2007 domain-containing protein [Bacteroidales bacterium]|nr:DUF2007 domain-containing protein [Bacteroidales bacterium]